MKLSPKQQQQPQTRARHTTATVVSVVVHTSSTMLLLLLDKHKISSRRVLLLSKLATGRRGLARSNSASSDIQQRNRVVVISRNTNESVSQSSVTPLSSIVSPKVQTASSSWDAHVGERLSLPPVASQFLFSVHDGSEELPFAVSTTM